VFPVPLPGVNKAHERTLVGSILTLRKTARKHGSPPEFVWYVVESLIFKGLNETFQKMFRTDEERKQWEEIKGRLKLIVEEPYGDERKSTS
jgi:hypothetical protein